ncbi:hypothetical protein SUGI_0870020 [Cryptomeria japonica]|nr:hypothetical protein SUGI_0870020 [Cryptomeria japonica]
MGVGPPSPQKDMLSCWRLSRLPIASPHSLLAEMFTSARERLSLRSRCSNCASWNSAELMLPSKEYPLRSSRETRPVRILQLTPLHVQQLDPCQEVRVLYSSTTASLKSRRRFLSGRGHAIAGEVKQHNIVMIANAALPHENIASMFSDTKSLIIFTLNEKRRSEIMGEE